MVWESKGYKEETILSTDKMSAVALSASLLTDQARLSYVLVLKYSSRE